MRKRIEHGGTWPRSLKLPARKHRKKQAGDPSLSAQMADELCSHIRDQRLIADDLLGTEGDLASRFSVSRTVVREAVGQLRGLGIVQSRQGAGLRVAGGDVIGTLSKVLAPSIGDSASWDQMRHLRFVLEVGSVPLAAHRAAPAQIRELKRIADVMVKLAESFVRSGDSDQRKQIAEQIGVNEARFHSLVLAAAGDKLAERFHGLLLDYFQEIYGHGPHSEEPNVDGMLEHLALVEAIEKRDAEAAMRILVEHLRPEIFSAADSSETTPRAKPMRR